MKRINIFTLIISLMVMLTGCFSQQKKSEISDLNFIVIGNTYPESPYKAYKPKLKNLIFSLNKENPTFVIHSGNFINAGKNNFGLKEYDINTQMSNFFKETKKLTPIMYNTVGKMDTFKDYNIYKKFTKNNPYHSFNYGNIHFVIIDCFEGYNNKISEKQLKWLEKDLDDHSSFAGIIIVSNLPFFSSRYKLNTMAGARKLHRLFMHYPVKAVISGEESKFHKLEKDGILYINAGTAPITRKTRFRENDYYRFEISNHIIYTTGKKIIK